MDIKVILFIIIIIVMLYIVVRYYLADVNTLTSIVSATTLATIPASKLATNGLGVNSNNFSYAIWMYIEDWNYNYGEYKYVFTRMGATTAPTAPSSSDKAILSSQPCPCVTLDAIQNNLRIDLTITGVDSAAVTQNDVSDPNNKNYMIHTCYVNNFPIQKWVSVVVSVYGKSLDVYLDGKLVRTSVLPGVPVINPGASVYVTPAGGFSGWTSKFQYYPNATDPQTAWNIYEQGYGANWLSNLFGNYQVKVSFLENGNEDGSFTI